MQTILFVSQLSHHLKTFLMKKLVVILLLFSTTISLAQKNKNKEAELPAFGEISKAELEMKECDFDNKAEAVVLLDDGVLEFSSDLELKRRLRIKILNSKGMEWANVHLRYRSEKNAENISKLDAQTYNLDANGNIVISKVEGKLVYEKKINKKYSEKVFTFPDVKVGSIIEYKFRHSGVGLIDWYFQRSIPVKYSRFVIDYPSEIEISVAPYCSRKYEGKTEDKNRRIVKTYSIANVPSLKDEPFIINEDFYRDRLETKLIAYNINGIKQSRVANWLQIIRFLMEDEDFGVQIKKNIPRTADLDEKLKNISSLYEKMKIIYKYVQNNMEWNEYEGIWALDGVKAAWKDKKGTAGEINLILVNLLKDADLEVHPILVSTHENGVVNTIDAGTYDFPGYHQFNKVLAYVKIGEKEYVLDATSKETPPYLIPSDVLLTQGLVIEKIDTYEWGWKTIWNKDLMQKSIIMTNGAIDETGKMKGEATIISYDYARLARLPLAKKGKDKFLEKYVTVNNPGMMVDDVTFENLDSDSLPLIQKIKFNHVLNSSGDYKYFSTNFLSGLEKNPFVADNRFSDVFFGCNQSYTILGNFTIPEGYEFEELPKNVKMILPDTSITVTRLAQLSGDRLMTKIQLDFKRAAYEATEYAELQEFYKRLFDLLNEQFVIRKIIKT
jgi:hypothetical protein